MWIALCVIALAVVLLISRKRSPSQSPPAPGTSKRGWLVVHRMTYLETMNGMLHDQGGVELFPIAKSLGGAAAGQPNDDGGLVPLPKSLLEQAKTTAERQWSSGLEALKAQPLDAQKTEGGFWACFGDNASTRILKADAIAELELEGTPIAMVPNANVLLIAGSDDVAALEKMLAQAHESFTGAEYRTLQAFALRDGEWHDWMPGTGHPLLAKFRAARSQTQQRDFDELRARGPVAHTTARDAEHGGELVAAWVAGTKVMLPEADRYVLIDPEANDELHRMEVTAEAFELAYAGERKPALANASLVEQFPTRHERLFMKRFTGSREGTPSDAEIDAAADHVGGFVLRKHITEEGVSFQVVLTDGRWARVNDARAEELATRLRGENAARFKRVQREVIDARAAFTALRLTMQPPPSGPEMLEAAMEAFSLYEAGSFEAAKVIFTALTVADPKEAYYLCGLGAVLLAQEKLDKAKDAFTRALALNPKELAAHVNLGEVYLRQGKVVEAAQCFKTAVELDPETKDPLTQRARVLAAAALQAIESAQKAKAEASAEAADEDDAEDSDDADAADDSDDSDDAEAPSETQEESRSENLDLLAEAGKRSALMAVLRPPGYAKGSQRNWQTIANVNGVTEKIVVPERMTFPLADGIEIELVYDTGETMLPILAHQAAGNQAHTLKRAAIANLEAASMRPLVVAAQNVWVGNYADGFAASRLLVPGIARALGSGPLAAFTPTYNCFIVARADDPSALAKAVELSREAAGRIREQYGYREALTHKPWILCETGWTVWTSPPAALQPELDRLAAMLETAHARSMLMMEQLSPQPAARA
jgi:tetratricopeptide (TPR) repeat protein